MVGVSLLFTRSDDYREAMAVVIRKYCDGEDYLVSLVFIRLIVMIVSNYCDSDRER